MSEAALLVHGSLHPEGGKLWKKCTWVLRMDVRRNTLSRLGFSVSHVLITWKSEHSLQRPLNKELSRKQSVEPAAVTVPRERHRPTTVTSGWHHASPRETPVSREKDLRGRCLFRAWDQPALPAPRECTPHTDATRL